MSPIRPVDGQGERSPALRGSTGGAVVNRGSGSRSRSPQTRRNGTEEGLKAPEFMEAETRRDGIEGEESMTASPFVEAETRYQGSLTPALSTGKRKRGRPRKAVSFGGGGGEQGGVDVQLGFRDIPKRGQTGGGAEGVNGVEEDEEAAEPRPKQRKGRPKKKTTAKGAADTTTEGNGIEAGQPAKDAVHAEADLEAEPDLEAHGHSEHQALFTQMLQKHGLEEELGLMKRIILEKLTGKRRMQLVGVDEEYEKVHQLVEQTVTAGEGNSALVIGARGSGKTTLVETVIADLSRLHRDDFHVVRLNGFIHTDDKLALREIWRQLGREMDVDDDTIGRTSNYADTLSSLLALLSHPSETALPDDPSDPPDQPPATAKSIIFILDEFDLFASHPRQTLLYNLFDIAQARKAPIAVLGLTTRINVVESLEKRVKSRFSHRYVHLPLARTPAVFWSICKHAITVSPNDISTLSDHEKTLLSSPQAQHLFSTWSSFLDHLYLTSPTLSTHITTTYHLTKSIPSLLSSLLLPISTQLTPARLPTFTFTSTSLTALSPPPSKLSHLPSLSTLALALLIATARLSIILSLDTCNFNMAYDEYLRLATAQRASLSASGASAIAGARVWGRDLALAAWEEELVALELLLPVFGGGSLVGVGVARGGGGGVGSMDVGRAGKMWRADVALEEIAGSCEKAQLGGGVGRWCREI